MEPASRDDYMAPFCEAVRRRMLELDLTFFQLALQLDVASTSTAHRLTQAARMPHPAVWQRVTAELGIDRVALLLEVGYLRPEDVGSAGAGGGVGVCPPATELTD